MFQPGKTMDIRPSKPITRLSKNLSKVTSIAQLPSIKEKSEQS